MKEFQIKINVNFRIMPFGHVFIEVKGREEEKETKEKGAPVYVEPNTTNPQLIEITFGEADYSVPKTTAGIL